MFGGGLRVDSVVLSESWAFAPPSRGMGTRCGAPLHFLTIRIS